jgi:hypothetical protein
MVKCPVCCKIDMNCAFSGCELLIGGKVTRVCSYCYHKAFIKTNLDRMLRRRKFSGYQNI